MTIHVGLIGGGNISETHARAAMSIPGVQVSAIYGSNFARVTRLCGECGATAYSNFDEFLSHKPMEFVAIGSPSGLHAEQGIAAARRGLHVLTEKPLEISIRKGQELIAAAKDAEVKLGVFFQDRFKPDILQLKEWMDAKILGTPILADARVKWFRPATYYSDSRWRGTLALDGGGALINQAIHTVDLLLWLFGDVTSVQAQKKTALHRIEAEDTLVALLEFANGAMGVLQATTSTYPGYPRRVELTGSEGTVILEHDRLIAADLRNPPRDFRSLGDDKNASANSAAVSDTRGHRAVLEDFVDAIQSGREPRCSGTEGLRSVALVETIYDACRWGKRVDLER
ncbi:MAG TPA: Gfo/Idh/MocA family oxidoreductase [Candidatus Acidoferrum sp.]|nr:Gfo/Idh/MocA family oxidoreductase [Candidatus Acidoferrum sp.]